MADLTPFPPGGASDSARTSMEINNSNIQVLLNCHADSSPPSSPVNGMLWVDTTNATRYVVNLYQNGGWVVLTDKIAEGNRDFDNKQALNLVLEKLGSGALWTPSPLNEGRVAYEQDNKLLVYGDQVQLGYAGGWKADGSAFRAFRCELNTHGLGSPAAADTSTRHGGFAIASAGEEVNCVGVQVPVWFTGAHDARWQITYLLSGAETAADEPKFNGNARAIAPGDSVNKAATSLAVSTDNIGTETAASTLHRAYLTHPYNDASNPIAAKSDASLVLGRSSVGGAGECGTVIVVQVDLLVPCYSGADE